MPAILNALVGLVLIGLAFVPLFKSDAGSAALNPDSGTIAVMSAACSSNSGAGSELGIEFVTKTDKVR